jgi:hypothetical protein
MIFNFRGCKFEKATYRKKTEFFETKMGKSKITKKLNFQKQNNIYRKSLRGGAIPGRSRR